MLLTPGESLVLEVACELIENPPLADYIDYDDAGIPWVKLPAQTVSDLLLERFGASYSVKSTRRALDGLVTKGYLLREQRIGDHKWNAAYFYRLPAGKGT